MMDEPRYPEDFRAQEGALDMQLPLPSDALPVPVVLARITKRDGRDVEFDTAKIADSIFRAAQSIGGTDQTLARSLAVSISLYLGRERRAEPLHVSEVAGAVERVLVEMGHERTALAYVQHRERHSGDVNSRDARSVRDALLEWRWNRSGASARAEAPSVESTLETLELAPDVKSNIRARVNDVLKLLPEDSATPGLVGELVRAFAREDHGRDVAKPRPFSMSLETLELAISGAEKPAGLLMTPADSDLVIARRVKEAYGLNSLFSGDVANAHIRGDLHIHHLAQVDRLDSLRLYPEVVKVFGAPDKWAGAAEPARRIEQLIDDLVATTRVLQTFFADSVQWDAINYGLAPYIVEFDEAHMQKVARRLVNGLIDTGESGVTTAVKLHLAWDLPHDMHGLEAIGPNGANTQKAYSEYSTTAQKFAHTLLQVMRDAALDEALAAHVMPVVAVPHNPGADASSRAFMNRIALSGLVLSAIEYECDTKPLSLPFAEQLLHPREVLAQTVSLNLPRLGRAAQEGHHFWTALDQLFDIAVEAMSEKRRFVRELAQRKKNGPYSYLTLVQRGDAFAQLERAGVALNVCGLNECARALRESTEFQDQPLSVIQQNIVTYLAARCHTWTTQADVKLYLTAGACPVSARRFAGLDARLQNAKKAPEAYTEGVSRFPADGSYRTFEKALNEIAHLHTTLQGNTPLRRPNPDSAFPEQLSQSLEEFFGSKPEMRLHLHA